MDVIAVQRGHDGRRVVEVGEKFSVPAARLTEPGAWFVRAEQFAPRPVDPMARPPGAGPRPGSNVVDEDDRPGAGPLPGVGPRSNHDVLA